MRTTEQSNWASEHVRLLSLKMGHHASASGYDRLGDYLNCEMVKPFTSSESARKFTAKLLSPLIQNSGSQWYNRNSALQELDATISSLRSSGGVHHFLYGENCYRYFNQAPRRFRSPRASIATYHTTPQRFSEVVTNTGHISRLDMAIVMSNAQRPIFDGILPPDRVRFIPHGVDTDYYLPPEAVSSSNSPASSEGRTRFFCAGRMLRDYPTLAKTASILAGRNAAIEIIILAKPEIADLFTGIENTKILSGVSDKELLRLYQSSDALIMPLQDCTANNVLLEAMACGLGVVATDLLGVRDYTNEKCRELVEPNSAEALAEAMLNLANNDKRREEMGKAAREQALKLSWPIIAEQHIQLYREAI